VLERFHGGREGPEWTAVRSRPAPAQGHAIALGGNVFDCVADVGERGAKAEDDALESIRSLFALRARIAGRDQFVEELELSPGKAVFEKRAYAPLVLVWSGGGIGSGL